MSFTTTTVLSDEDMMMIVCAGFESGDYGSLKIVEYDNVDPAKCPDWAKDCFGSGKPWPRYCWAWAVGTIHVKDRHGDGEKGVITRESLQRGLHLLASKYPKVYARLIDDGGDAVDADALLQAAAFGDVIYG